MDLLSDDAVAATNDDASLCKFQAISKGYYKDNFLEQFLSARMKSSSTRKAPEINRGYFARSASITYLLEAFIQANPTAQILSLGAGYDSMFWRLKSHQFLRQGDNESSVKYVEVDMSPVVVHKIMAIRRHRILANLLSNISYKGEGLHSDEYSLISFDLRQVKKDELKQKLFEDCKLDPSRPTLCLTECVLVYMPIENSNSLIHWLGDNFSRLTMINYEQCNMDDRFGSIMLSNMNERHCDLMGVEACKSLESQANRFKSNDLNETKAWTMSEIYESLLLPSEVERIEMIEFLDEKELLDQLLHHYCVVIGSNHPLDWLQSENFWLAKTI